MVAAGDLNRRILIRRVDEIPNASFGVDVVPDAGIARWAKVEPIHGLALRAGMQTGEAPTHLFFVRCGAGTRVADITLNHVIDWQGRRYRVIDCINVEDANEFTRITAKDLGAIA